MADITSNLELHLKLDEQSGQTATDSSYNGYNGTLGAGLTFTTDKVSGVFGGALGFTGVNGESITITGHTNLDFTDENFTIAFWTNLEGVDGDPGTSRWMMKNQTSWNADGWIFEVKSHAIKFYTATGGGNDRSDSSSFLDDGNHYGVWRHYVIIKTGATVTMYDNGSLLGMSTVDTHGDVIAGATPMRIGGNSATDQIDFPMDDIRIYSRALAVDDITKLYENPYQNPAIMPGIFYDPFLNPITSPFLTEE